MRQAEENGSLYFITRSRSGLFPACMLLLAGSAPRTGCSLPAPLLPLHPCPRQRPVLLTGLKAWEVWSWYSVLGAHQVKASVLLCLTWAFSLQRKWLFGRTLRTTTAFFTLYFRTGVQYGSNNKQPQWNQLGLTERLVDLKKAVVWLITADAMFKIVFFFLLDVCFFLMSVIMLI